MIFNEFSFIFGFLPIVLALFFMPRLKRIRAYTLITSSFVFYGLAGVEHAIVLGIEIIWVYAITSQRKFRDNTYLLTAVVLPVALALIYYKYLGFFVGSILDLQTNPDKKTFSLFLDVALPAGISFFTFQLISYAIDLYRGDIKEVPTFSHFAAYISFFPQLVAGPILRYRNVAVPLRYLEQYNFDLNNTARGIGYICIGLGVKVLLADTLGHYISEYRGDPSKLTQLASVYTLFAYSFQIYFDFYGYSLVAIGLGALFGFNFPANFRFPYEALNPREFWRRWHITLSFWIRDYLYIPLGGNKAYIRNIIIVMALCGLWHGAGGTFIIWGLYHAAMVVGYHIWQKSWDKWPIFLQQVMTFVLVSLGWVLFLFDFKGAKEFFSSMIGINQSHLANPTLEMWIALVITAVVCFTVRLELIAENNFSNLWSKVSANFGLAVLFVGVMLFLVRSETFIYFRF
jgi:alginate O-acetyltransferase complex protein AlgI